MQETKSVGTPPQPLATERKDGWWIEPTLVAIGFTLFIIYATVRALENQFYEIGPYLSPFYSPKLVFDWWKFSPAILILWIPAGFRATCYYYRKAYYRSYFLTPPACAVTGAMPGKSYSGETKFPFVFQNLHRYMLYLAILVVGFLWYDAVIACTYEGQLRIGMGSIIFLLNVIFLSGYTFGCHALRHIVGGKMDCFSCSAGAKAKFGAWSFVTKLNEHHMLWAWISLFSVGFTDFYVRLVASHAITDLTFIGPTLSL